MKITKDERLYLNDLSQKLFGSSSKWYKNMLKGEVADMTEKLEDGTERKYKGIKYFTIDEVKKLLEDLWKEELETKAKEAEELAKKQAEANKQEPEVVHV